MRCPVWGGLDCVLLSWCSGGLSDRSLEGQPHALLVMHIVRVAHQRKQVCHITYALNKPSLGARVVRHEGFTLLRVGHYMTHMPRR